MGLSAIPSEIGSLCRLQQLNLRGCCKLESLPDSIGSLGSLRVLQLSDITRVPKTFMNLSSLQYIRLSGNPGRYLPRGFRGSFRSIGGMIVGREMDAAFRLTRLSSLDLSYSALQALSDSFVVLVEL